MKQKVIYLSVPKKVWLIFDVLQFTRRRGVSSKASVASQGSHRPGVDTNSLSLSDCL